MSHPCDRPVELGTLTEYWLADPRVPDDDALEEHLLACGACSARLAGLVALGDGVARLAGEGAVEVVVTPAFLSRASQQGLRTREYRVAPGGRVDCTVTPEDDLLVGRLEGDFGGISRLDVVVLAEGRPEQRISDVPVNPEARELILAQAMPVLRALGRTLFRVRLLGQGASGERLVGEYTFDHTPARPS